MRDGGRADRTGRLDDRERLLRPLGGHRERIHPATQHIALDQDPDESIEDCLPRIDGVVLDRSDRARLPGDGLALRGRRATGVHIDGVDGPPLLGEVRDTVGGVETA